MAISTSTPITVHESGFVIASVSEAIHLAALEAGLPRRFAPRNDGAEVGMKTVLVSAVALFDVDGRVLLTQRPEGKSLAGMWEFPGGKIEPGETPEAALKREIREELGIEICDRCAAPLTFVSHAYEHFHLLMMLYVCRKWEGIPQPMEGQQLTWKYPRDMQALPMPPADIPLVTALMDSIVPA